MRRAQPRWEVSSPVCSYDLRRDKLGIELVEISQEHKGQIEEIISDMECPKDFECYKSEFAHVGKVKDAGIESLLECSEEKPEMCTFSLPFGYAYLCECPLRHYIAENFGI